MILKVKIWILLHFQVKSKDDLISHIGQNVACLGHYGSKGLQKLKEFGPRDITAKYQEDENTACAPIIEDGYSKLDHSRPQNILTLPQGTILHPRFPGNDWYLSFTEDAHMSVAILALRRTLI